MNAQVPLFVWASVAPQKIHTFVGAPEVATSVPRSVAELAVTPETPGSLFTIGGPISSSRIVTGAGLTPVMVQFALFVSHTLKNWLPSSEVSSIIGTMNVCAPTWPGSHVKEPDRFV